MTSTAVLPSTYEVESFKHIDPRFYAGKDVIIAFGREDDSYVPPENAFLVPLVKYAVVVSVRKGLGSATLRPLERTDRIPHIPGTI